MKQYLDEMTVLALKLNKAIMETLGSTGQDMGEMNLSKKGLSIHLYPECPDPTLTLGSKQHVDITTLTILLGTEEVGGLQLLKDGHWVDYKPIPGSFAVILGEQMKVKEYVEFAANLSFSLSTKVNVQGKNVADVCPENAH